MSQSENNEHEEVENKESKAELDQQGSENSESELDQQESADSESESNKEVSVEEQLEQAQSKADENWNTVLRMKADLENQRRRNEKQVEDAHKYAV